MSSVRAAAAPDVEGPAPVTPTSAAVTAVPAVPAAAAASASAGASSGCPACWGVGAPTFGQAISTAVNHLFNSTFDWLSTLPASPFTNLLEGTLVLVRRTLFLIPTGVTATQKGDELTVKVNTGSVAYLRRDGNTIEVSGLPSFKRADQFDEGTVADVMVSNPGNAGCAGFVLDSGHVAAALTTDQIDSIRFGSDARFDDTVTATVAGGGPLMLRDAVRGHQGVDIDAPVVLKSNVEIDGGSCETQNSTCDVTFHGTVDAATAGKQSLTVTALGTTTFDAAVGGQAALASLLTRGITPLKIDQSADTKTIPLHYQPFLETDAKGGVKTQVKYGIDVAIGNNPSQMYEFDTGGDGFFAGYNPTFWKNVPLTTVADTVSFTSGNTLNFVVADAAVTLGQGAQTVSTAQPIQVGASLTGGNDKRVPPVTFVFTNPDAPPFDGFFGDFGASFGVFNLRQAGLQPLASPLFQLPGNLSTGFLVQLGPIGTTDPQLTVGITDALRDQFRYAVPVSVASPAENYPVSGYPVLDLFGFKPTYSADGPEGLKSIGCESEADCPPLKTLIDSGAPSTSLRVTAGEPYKDGKKMSTDAKLIAAFPTSPDRQQALTWTLKVGDTDSVDAVGYGGESAATKGDNVNTGLNLYNTFDVMFDVKNQIIWLRPNDGTAKVVAASVTTTGDQIYRQNAELGGNYNTSGGKFTVGGVATLAGDTVVNAGSGDVSFYGAVDGVSAGDQSLTVNSSGTTTFTRGVGEQVALSSFLTDQGGTTVSAGVTTEANQEFDDPVSLSGSYAVKDGLFLVARDATLAGPVSVINDGVGQAITFGGRIEGSATRGYTLSLAAREGTVTLEGDVGASHPLGGMVVDARPVKADSVTATGAMTFTAKGTINLDGGLGNAPTVGLSIGPEIKKESGDSSADPGSTKYLTVNLMHGGVIQGFADDGVMVGSKDRIVSGQISGFVISRNGGWGVETKATDGLTLSDNAVIGNASGGLHSQEDAGLTLLDNSFRGNGAFVPGHIGGPANGIELAGSRKTAITNNVISDNTASGILATEKDAPVDTRNTISGNTISGNAVGVTVDANSQGNGIQSNSIHSNGKNTRDGITLVKTGNADQPAPENIDARVVAGTLSITGSVAPYSGYTGKYTLQVFLSPSTDSPNIQGRTFLTAQNDVAAGDFQIMVDGISPLDLGSFITVTATPSSDPANTSEFSEAAEIKA